MAGLFARIAACAALVCLSAASLPSRGVTAEAAARLAVRSIPAEVRGPLAYDAARRLFYGFGIERDDAGALVRVAFEIERRDGGWRYRRIYVFEPGEYVGATLAPDGSLFGAKSALPGALFRLVRVGPSEWRYETVHEFTSAEGSFPGGTTTFAPEGDVAYGRTECGAGAGACRGIVYRLTKRRVGWRLSVIHRFTDETGFDSQGPMALLDGALYGAVAAGGPGERFAGAAFRLAPGADPDQPWTFAALHRFRTSRRDYLTQVTAPAGLTPSGGFLYGAASGGRGQSGVVYRVRPDGSGFAVVKTFFGAALDDEMRKPEGSFPDAEFAIGDDGAIFGATRLGGAKPCDSPGGCGTLFALQPKPDGGFAFETLHSFAGRAIDGENPATGPILVSGELHGLVQRGRRADADGVYRFRIEE